MASTECPQTTAEVTPKSQHTGCGKAFREEAPALPSRLATVSPTALPDKQGKRSRAGRSGSLSKPPSATRHSAFGSNWGLQPPDPFPWEVPVAQTPSSRDPTVGYFHKQVSSPCGLKQEDEAARTRHPTDAALLHLMPQHSTPGSRKHLSHPRLFWTPPFPLPLRICLCLHSRAVSGIT